MSEDPKLNTKGLRNFGLQTGFIVVVLFGLIFPWLRGRSFPVWSWIVASGLWAWALLVPGSLEFVYRGWMRVGAILGWINTRIILGLIFSIVIIPMGALRRLFSKDLMPLKFDNTLSTYRVASQTAPKEEMEKPF